jgi:hypothetical protein
MRIDLSLYELKEVILLVNTKENSPLKKLLKVVLASPLNEIT